LFSHQTTVIPTSGAIFRWAKKGWQISFLIPQRLLTRSAWLWLRIISCACSGGNAWLVDLDANCVVLIRLVRGMDIEGNNVIRLGVADASRDFADQIVRLIQNTPATLDCQHLEADITGQDA
jgi:hypothetical protein